MGVPRSTPGWQLALGSTSWYSGWGVALGLGCGTRAGVWDSGWGDYVGGMRALPTDLAADDEGCVPG